MTLIFRGVRLVDRDTDREADLVVRDGLIAEVLEPGGESSSQGSSQARGVSPVTIDARGLILMPSFVELHAHFRDPGLPEKETLESGCLAAVAGGYGTVACMANTKPILDDAGAALALRRRAKALGLVDLYPALSFTRAMEGKDCGHLDGGAMAEATRAAVASGDLRLLSEDGKDVLDEGIFTRALRAASGLGVLASCHCDFGGEEAEAAKKEGAPRSVWSKIEEDRATERALRLAEEAGVSVHIAHVSTAESLELVRAAKGRAAQAGAGRAVTCEAAPHHLLLTEADAQRLGPESHGRVNPPLRSEADRLALLQGLSDGTIDAIATDHAPHSEADKANGSPGFTGLETAFSSCVEGLVDRRIIDLKRLSALMSANPAFLLGLADRGLLRVGYRADLILVDSQSPWTVEARSLRSRGKNSPLLGRTFSSRVVLTVRGGSIVYDALDQGR